MLLYDMRNQQNQGWVCVTVARTSESGWCPLSYLAPEGPVMAPPPASAPPPIPSGDRDTDGGFSGSLMGGTVHATPVSVVASTNDNSRSAQPAMSTFSQIGSSIQSAGRNSWTAVSNGAQRTGEYTKDTFVETKYRVEGMTGQQKKIANKPAFLRTEGEQRAVDVGNYAARGAVVGGVRSAIYNPSLRGLARGATRGAVTGGTWGAVRKWKPFG